jgi:phosphoribosylformimino-5-aminoimidazole carboxamide ribotide isomerase
MELLPAIDLRHGAAVRLTRGDFAREQDYGDPAGLAARYIEGGARWIHVVDLEAARTGVWHERAAMDEIMRLAAASSVRVQVGGGIRTADAAAELLESGFARVVLGTAALDDPGLATRSARRWPGRVAVGLDYRVNEHGVAEAQAQGWQTASGRSVPELLDQWAGEPIGAVVVTAVERDGTLEGPAVESLAALLFKTELPLIASGGVGATQDLYRLAHIEANGRRLAGAIVGKALVEHRFSVEEGVAACAVSV